MIFASVQTQCHKKVQNSFLPLSHNTSGHYTGIISDGQYGCLVQDMFLLAYLDTMKWKWAGDKGDGSDFLQKVATIGQNYKKEQICRGWLSLC